MPNILDSAIAKVTAATLSGSSYAEVKKNLFTNTSIVGSIHKQIQKIRKQLGKNAPTSFEDLNIRNQSPALLSDIDELQRFFQDSEQSLNAMVFKKKTEHALGTEVKERWTALLFKDPSDALRICTWANANTFLKNSQRILEAVLTKDTNNGASEMLANAPRTQQIHETEGGTENALIALLQGASESQRYEMYTRVDAYLRSNHAKNDLEGDAPQTKSLRNAFNNLIATPTDAPEYKEALFTAKDALYKRFDQIFEYIHVKSVPDKDGNRIEEKGTLETYRKANGIDPATTPYMCTSRGTAGYIDVAIRSQTNPEEWFIGFATAVSSNQSFSTIEGNQLALHGEAMQRRYGAANVHISFVEPTFVNLYSDNSTSRMTKVQKEWAELGVEKNKPRAVTAFNSLPIIAKIDTRTNGFNRANTRFLTVGSKLDWRTEPLTKEEWSTKVLDTVQTVLPYLLDPDTPLPSGPKHVGSLIMAMLSQVLNAHQEDQTFLQDPIGEKWDSMVEILDNKKQITSLLHENAPSIYIQDVDALRNSLVNLARNAIKFKPQSALECL